MDDVLSYLNNKSVEYRIDGQEAIITCPNCAKDKLYINLNSGVYHCFRCEVEDPTSIYSRGHISQLKEEWGDVISIAPAIRPIAVTIPNEKATEGSNI